MREALRERVAYIDHYHHLRHLNTILTLSCLIATIGDVNIPRPSGLLDFAGKAKWYALSQCSGACFQLNFLFFSAADRDSWKSIEGMSKDDAQKAYVEKLLEV